MFLQAVVVLLLTIGAFGVHDNRILRACPREKAKYEVLDMQLLKCLQNDPNLREIEYGESHVCMPIAEAMVDLLAKCEDRMEAIMAQM